MPRIPKHTVVDTDCTKAGSGNLAPKGAKVVTLNLTGHTGSIKARQRIEQTIALVTAQALLDTGYSLGVNDGEETTIHHSRDIAAIQKALFTTDEDWLLVYKHEAGHIYSDADGAQHEDNRADYWVRFVYGNDGWDVISDYTVHLEPVIGEGTIVQKLIDHAEEYGVVPDLTYRNHKLTVTV